MAIKLRLEVCAYFEPEVRAALREESIADVELATFRGGCDDRALPASRAMEAESRVPVLRIGGHCMGGASPCRQLYEIDSCFDLLLGPVTVSRYLSQGVHLLTPTMLQAWRDYAAALGLAPADAQFFFGESCSRMVLADSGVVSLSTADIDAYQAFTGVPLEIVPTGLDYLRRYLRRCVAATKKKTDP